MANSKSKVLSPVRYPTLQPKDYLCLAVCNDLTQNDARILSGFSRGTWDTWLYRSNKSKRISSAFTERLYRVANDMGWLENEGAIAA